MSNTDKQYDLNNVFNNFQIYGDFVSAVPYGSGHINDTFLLKVKQGGHLVKYIVQRLNNVAFPDPLGLMDNIQRITDHLQKKLKAAGDPDASRKSMSVLLTNDGKNCFVENGNYWRCYLFVENAVGHDIILNTAQAFEAAKAFGDFQKLLVDLPGERLVETIPNFHNTPKRFERFEQVLAEDKLGLAKNVQAEVDFILSRKDVAYKLLDLNAQGLIPERITHNDTKLNNVLLDKDTEKATCVIDLDTSMPGLALYDFGDMIRTSTSPAAEDEKDLSKVQVQMDMFEALVQGYLSTAAEFLTPTEKDNLAFSGILLTLECSIRFLTDYLEGDVYFRVHHDGHNLDRCRTQHALILRLEEKMTDLEDIVNQEYTRIMG